MKTIHDVEDERYRAAKNAADSARERLADALDAETHSPSLIAAAAITAELRLLGEQVTIAARTVADATIMAGG